MVGIPTGGVYKTLGALAPGEICSGPVGQVLTPDAGASLSPRTASDDAPLTYRQERLWWWEQHAPGDRYLHVPVVLHLAASPDLGALQRSLDAIVRRHHVLRTRLVIRDGRPRQRWASETRCPITLRDVSRLGVGEQDARTHQYLDEHAGAPFNLTREPPLRVLVVRVARDRFVLACVFHRIACDGWSILVFIRDLTDVYRSTVQGHSCLSERPIDLDYGAYASSLRRCFDDPIASAEPLDFWMDALADHVVHEIALDRSRTGHSAFRAGRQTLTISEAETAAVAALVRRCDATMFVALLAALAIFIQRRTGQHDVCVGTVVSGRLRPEWTPLVGSFVNTVVLRHDLGDDPRVGDLLARLRETCREAFAHQHVPFELLLDRLQPERDVFRRSLFQVSLEYADVLAAAGSDVDVRLPASWPESSAAAAVNLLDETDTHAQADLEVLARSVGDRLVLTLVHRRDAFGDESAGRFLRDVHALLRSMAEHPQARVSTLPLAGDADAPRAEPRRVPRAPSWEPFLASACEQSIAARFSQVALQHADRIAVADAAGAWTYQRLDARSAALAAQLSAPDRARIGLLLGHDATMVTGVLGVLRSGHAYVPLDAHHPLDRLVTIARDADLARLVVDPPRVDLARALADQIGRSLPIVQIEPAGQTTGARTPQTVMVDRDADAYLLYTSGSTGTPKGVRQTHRGVLRHVRAYSNNLGIGADDRVALLASYSFNAAVLHMFGALLNGATLVPIALRLPDPDALRTQLSSVTILHVTPTVYRHLLEVTPDDRVFAGTRVLALGGEVAAPTDVALYARRFAPHCVFVNSLGLTESATALQWVADRSTAVLETRVPIGWPVEDTTIRLLNADHDEVGPLAIGEIAITSEQVALGYWNDEVRTRRVFRADGARTRTYHTGDLGRMLPDGAIEFVGRADAQVKIRGVRIDPSEIEHQLAAQRSIAAACVVASRHKGSEPRLVAYVVRRESTELDLDRVRAELRTRLPDAMVPAAYVELPRLPTTVTGKVDRRALAAAAPSDVSHQPDTEPIYEHA